MLGRWRWACYKLRCMDFETVLLRLQHDIWHVYALKGTPSLQSLMFYVNDSFTLFSCGWLLFADAWMCLATFETHWLWAKLPCILVGKPRDGAMHGPNPKTARPCQHSNAMRKRLQIQQKQTHTQNHKKLQSFTYVVWRESPLSTGSRDVRVQDQEE